MWLSNFICCNFNLGFIWGWYCLLKTSWAWANIQTEMLRDPLCPSKRTKIVHSSPPGQWRGSQPSLTEGMLPVPELAPLILFLSPKRLGRSELSNTRKYIKAMLYLTNKDHYNSGIFCGRGCCTQPLRILGSMYHWRLHFIHKYGRHVFPSIRPGSERMLLPP